ALVVVLVGLLLATGDGSALAARVIRTRAGVSVAGLVAGLVLVGLPYLVGALAHATAESSLGVRVSGTGGCAAIVGVVLGTMFPSGMRWASRENGTPLALPINGVASVVGATSSILRSVWFGIPTTLLAAGVVYLAAAALGPSRWVSA